MNLNRVILIGRLTADPESRTTGSGTAVTNFRIATNRYYNDKSGTRQEQTEFHSIVAWARTAEVVRDYLKQGQMVMVEGRLQTRSWEKDGQKRYATEIIADQIQLGPKAGAPTGSNQASSTNAPSPEKKSAPAAAAAQEEDIPVIDEDTVMNFDDEAPKQVDPKDIPF